MQRNLIPKDLALFNFSIFSIPPPHLCSTPLTSFKIRQGIKNWFLGKKSNKLQPPLYGNREIEGTLHKNGHNFFLNFAILHRLVSPSNAGLQDYCTSLGGGQGPTFALSGQPIRYFA
jgi:hypothetical protein